MAVGDPIASPWAPSGAESLVPALLDVVRTHVGLRPSAAVSDGRDARGPRHRRSGNEGSTVAGLEWAELDADGLRAAARSVRATISALEHQERLLLVEIAARRAFTVDGSRDVADWSAANLGISRRKANDQLRLAGQLAAMPRLAQSALQGHLSSEQAKPAAELAQAAGTDTGWAAQAPHLPVGTLDRAASKRRRPSVEDRRAARSARHFRAWEEGLELRFRGSVPSDDGARLLAAIERAMPPRDHQTEGSLTPDQRRADGLIGLARTNLGADADPDRATVVAVVELAAVCDDDPAATAELETGQPLATETARRLVCDGRLQIVVQGRDGVAVGVDTTARIVTPAMRRALMRRDGGCRFGSCTSTRFLEAHHVVPWPSPTTMGNLAMICWHHHHAIHEGGWRLHGDPNGALHATHQSGTTVTSLPDGWLPDGSAPPPALVPLSPPLPAPPPAPPPSPSGSPPSGSRLPSTSRSDTRRSSAAVAAPAAAPEIGALFALDSG